MTSPVLHTAENFEFVVQEPFLLARVWRRKDLSMEQGAQLAQRFADHAVALAEGRRSLIMDMRDAPTVVGPITEGAFHRFLEAWERSSNRIAIVSVDLVQRFQYANLVKAHAPESGRVVESLAEAQAWCRRGKTS